MNGGWRGSHDTSSQGGGGGGGGGSKGNGVPAKDVARPDWLNTMTSIFGYDQQIPLPSCFGDFVRNTIGNLLPFLPGLSSASEEAFGVTSRAVYNRALTYAATTSSKTFGTSFLKYPFNSSVFRGLLAESAGLANAAPMAGVVTAEGQALYNEIQTMRQGACQ